MPEVPKQTAVSMGWKMTIIVKLPQNLFNSFKNPRLPKPCSLLQEVLLTISSGEKDCLSSVKTEI